MTREQMKEVADRSWGFDLRKAASGLLGLMDEVEIDPALGCETDRVFSHREFAGLRKALECEGLKAKALEAIRYSSIIDFPDALTWAQWCRDVVCVVLDGDERKLVELLSVPKNPRN